MRYDQGDDGDGYDAELATLEARLGGGATILRGFNAELAAMSVQTRRTGADVSNLSRAFGGGLKRAFDGVVFEGDRLSDALRGMANSMLNAAYNSAVRPVANALGGALAGGIANVLPFADGAPFAQGRVMPFATGGIVSGPVTFPMRGGTGLMGEAGPEAILPLRRGPDGRLGVDAGQGGGRPVNVTFNITTPDVAGFRRSKTQIAAEMSRAMARGARNR